MGQRLIISEEEKNHIEKMYGFVDETYKGKKEAAKQAKEEYDNKMRDVLKAFAEGGYYNPETGWLDTDAILKSGDWDMISKVAWVKDNMNRRESWKYTEDFYNEYYPDKLEDYKNYVVSILRNTKPEELLNMDKSKAEELRKQYDDAKMEKANKELQDLIGTVKSQLSKMGLSDEEINKRIEVLFNK